MLGTGVRAETVSLAKSGRMKSLGCRTVSRTMLRRAGEERRRRGRCVRFIAGKARAPAGTRTSSIRRQPRRPGGKFGGRFGRGALGHRGFALGIDDLQLAI